MSRSQEARKQEHDAMFSVMEKRGLCVLPDEDIYGWVDYVAQRHISSWEATTDKKSVKVEHCSWVLDPNAEIEESYVEQFDDTFSANSGEHVINAYPASCICGKYTDRTLRYKGDIGSFLSLLFKDEPA